MNPPAQDWRGRLAPRHPFARWLLWTAVAVLVWNFRATLAQDLLLTGAFLYAAIRHPARWRCWRQPAGVLFLAAGGGMLAASALGTDPAASFRELLKYADVVLAALALPVLFHTRARLAAVLRYGAWGVTVCLGYDLLRIVAALGRQTLAGAHGLEPFLLVHSNQSSVMAGAAALALALPALAGGGSRGRRAADLAGAGVALAYLVVLASRGPQAAFVAAAAAAAVCWPARARDRWIMTGHAAGAELVVVLASAVLNPRFFERGEDGLLVDRDKAWRHTAALIRESPVLGYGHGCAVFERVYHGTRPPLSPHRFVHAHQELLQLGFAYGLPVLALTAAAWLTWFAALLRRVLAPPGPAAPRRLCLVVLALGVLLHVYGLADCWAQVAAMLAVWTVALGIGILALPEGTEGEGA